jgi:hypothetical protein
MPLLSTVARRLKGRKMAAKAACKLGKNMRHSTALNDITTQLRCYEYAGLHSVVQQRLCRRIWNPESSGATFFTNGLRLIAWPCGDLSRKLSQ